MTANPNSKALVERRLAKALELEAHTATDAEWTELLAAAIDSHGVLTRLQAEVERLLATGQALVDAVDQMIEDTNPIFAEMQLVRGRGPYMGKQIGDELEAFRTALKGTEHG